MRARRSRRIALRPQRARDRRVAWPRWRAGVAWRRQVARRRWQVGWAWSVGRPVGVGRSGLVGPRMAGTRLVWLSLRVRLPLPVRVLAARGCTADSPGVHRADPSSAAAGSAAVLVLLRGRQSVLPLRSGLSARVDDGRSALGAAVEPSRVRLDSPGLAQREPSDAAAGDAGSRPSHNRSKFSIALGVEAQGFLCAAVGAGTQRSAWAVADGIRSRSQRPGSSRCRRTRRTRRSSRRGIGRSRPSACRQSSRSVCSGRRNALAWPPGRPRR